MSVSDAVRLGAELIVKMYNDVHLRGQRRTVTSRLLDRIALRIGGREGYRDAASVIADSLRTRPDSRPRVERRSARLDGARMSSR